MTIPITPEEELVYAPLAQGCTRPKTITSYNIAYSNADKADAMLGVPDTRPILRFV